VLKLTADTSKARAYLRDLEQREIPRVIGRTLKRTANTVRTHASREMRSRINLQKSVLDQAITKRRSNEVQNLTALGLGRAWFEIRYSGKPFGIRDFAARETARGVTFKVSRIGSRKVYVRQGRKGFVVDRFGGHVFTRVGDDPAGPARAKIKKATGPSIPQFAATKRVQADLIKYAQEFWARELERNIRFAISRRK
jgi:hypothetical protein